VAKEIKHINDTVSDLPESFKMTELGPLPEEWKVVRLGKVVKTTKGKRPKDLLSKFSSKTIPYLTADFFRTGVASKYVSLEKKDYVEVGKDDIIFIWDGSNAGDVFLGVEGALASTMIKIEPLINVDKRFLFFFLKTKFELFNSTTTGTTIPHVNKSIFENLLVPLPPLSEQKAIAYVLQTVQRAKEATEKVIQATQELKKSLMRHLFTYGPVPIDEVDKVQLKETEIGLVPEHWEVVRLGEVSLKPQYGFTASATNQPIGPKFLRITDIQNGRINWNTVPYCKIDDTLLRKYQLESGDLLFARIGATTGKSVLINECPEAVFASYLIRVRVNLNQLLPEFLFYFTQGNLYWSQIDAAKGGRLKQGINIPVLLSLHIPLPPLHEQQTIAHILQTVDQKIQAEKAKKQALEILFQSLLHHLTTGKLRLKDMVLSEAKEA